MNAKMLFLSFLLGAVVAGTATWIVMRGPGGGAGAGTPHATAPFPAGPAADGTLAATKGEAAPEDPTLTGTPDATERLHALQSENRELEAEVESLEARIAELQPPPRDPRAFRFGLPEAAPTFDQAAWPALAIHMTELTRSLSELKDDLVAGKEPGPKQIAEIVKHNTPLATFAVAFGAEMSDPNPNGAYTHPAVIANLMRAALAEAELPLEEEQEIAIQVLGDAWVAEQERERQKMPASAPALARTVAEVDAKLRFLASVKNVLTSAQRDVLFHPETEGRLKLDLLSPALAYVLSFPVEAKGAEDMPEKLLDQLFGQAGIELEDTTPYAWVGREWVDAIPGVLVPQSKRSIDLIFPHVDQVQMRARAQVAATERVLAMGALPEEQAAQLRAVNSLLYPYVLRGGE